MVELIRIASAVIVDIEELAIVLPEVDRTLPSRTIPLLLFVTICDPEIVLFSIWSTMPRPVFVIIVALVKTLNIPCTNTAMSASCVMLLVAVNVMFAFVTEFLEPTR